MVVGLEPEDLYALIHPSPIVDFLGIFPGLHAHGDIFANDQLEFQNISAKGGLKVSFKKEALVTNASMTNKQKKKQRMDEDSSLIT